MSLDVDLYTDEPYEASYYSSNITHNLNKMAQEAGIYGVVWRPEENGITHAAQLIAPLRAGIALLEDEPARFRKLDSPNGWGKYEHFLPWLRAYLQACLEFPKAKVRVSR